VQYRDILDNHLWPVLARHFAGKPYRFQDDNAPVHRARIIEEFKRDNDIHSRYCTAFILPSTIYGSTGVHDQVHY
jgi:hypothetical protein